MLPRVHHLVGTAEIRRMLRVSRQRADALTRLPDFPAPVVDLEAGRVWERDAVTEWAVARGRAVYDDGGDVAAGDPPVAGPAPTGD
jgi:hypothetical protein